MSTIPTNVPAASSERRGWTERVLVEEMWASLAIVAIWFASVGLVGFVVWAVFVHERTPGSYSFTDRFMMTLITLIVMIFAYKATKIVAGRR